MKFNKSTLFKCSFFTDTVYTFSILLLLAAIFIFVFFHPIFSAKLIAQQRTRVLNDFINDLLISQQIDSQKFWKFRERYSQGYFEINPKALGVFETFKIIDRNDVGTTDLLFYRSPYIQSIDSITVDQSLIKEQLKLVDQNQILLNTDDLLLIQNEEIYNDNYLELWFILPIEEMRLANGFFNYTSDEMELLNGAVWLSYSKIKL